MIHPLTNAWQVDQAIETETERVVIMRFGQTDHPECMEQDDVLLKISGLVSKFAVIYFVDTIRVPDFNVMYELNDPFCMIFHYNNQHIKIDTNTGDNNKIKVLIADTQELIDTIETVYRGAKAKKKQVRSPHDYGNKLKY